MEPVLLFSARRRVSLIENFAQERGVALPELARTKTAAREAWAELSPTLDRIADLVMAAQSAAQLPPKLTHQPAAEVNDGA